MMAGDVRYCTSDDGVRIAYTVQGSGPPLLWLPLIFTSFSLAHELPWYNDFLQRISGGRTLIRFDQRGTGLSERVIDAHEKRLAGDASVVLDALGLERVSVLGGGPNGPAGISLAETQPQRVAALICIGAGASGALTPGSQEILEQLATMAPTNWERVARTLVGFNIRRTREESETLTSIYLRATTGHFVAAHFNENSTLDLRDSLSAITARTLIIHSEDDALYPFSGAQETAAGIANARLLPLAGNYSMTTLADMLPTVTDAITSFLDEDPETRAIDVAASAGPTSSNAFRTILFTDLVGHTEMMQRLGDEGGRSVLRDHERITRAILKDHGGTEIKTDGDSFMVSFGSVASAVECAVAIQRAFEVYNQASSEAITVRMGLNAGEPIEEDGPDGRVDLFGATVILAARIAAKADGGEILVADTVRGLCSGKGFLFADRGEFVAKGFEDPVRVYEVNWRHTTAS